MYTQKIELAPVGSNVWTDITKSLVPGGLKWSKININTQKSTTADGVDHLVRIRRKFQIELTFRELSDADVKTMLTLFDNEELQARLYSPASGNVETMTMRVSDTAIGFWTQYNGSAYWKGFSVVLTED